MSEDTETTTSAVRRSGNLSLWLAIWAIIISLICLYIAISAQGKVKDAERRLQRNVELIEESRTRVEELANNIQDELTLNKERIREISETAAKNESRLRTNTQKLDTTREVASRLIDSLEEQKEALTQHASRLEELTFSPEPPPEPEVATTETEEETPSEDTTGEKEATDRPRTYTVQSGDTLSQIARNSGVSVPELLDANPDIDPNLIHVGQVLNLPDPD